MVKDPRHHRGGEQKLIPRKSSVGKISEQRRIANGAHSETHATQWSRLYATVPHPQCGGVSVPDPLLNWRRMWLNRVRMHSAEKNKTSATRGLIKHATCIARMVRRGQRMLAGERSSHVGWHYLSKATCLIRPHLFLACFVVSKILICCYVILRF